jgi:hypothetical protein
LEGTAGITVRLYFACEILCPRMPSHLQGASSNQHCSSFPSNKTNPHCSRRAGRVGRKPSGDGLHGSRLKARLLISQTVRGPCIVRDRVLLGNTASPRQRVWDIACSSTAVEHSARSSMRSMMQLSDGPHSVWQCGRASAYCQLQCKMVQRGMRYVAVSEEKVQTAGVTLMLVYFC